MMMDGASLRCAADWSLDALGGHTWDAETEDVTWGHSKYGACGSIGRKIVSSAVAVAVALCLLVSKFQPPTIGLFSKCHGGYERSSMWRDMLC